MRCCVLILLVACTRSSKPTEPSPESVAIAPARPRALGRPHLAPASDSHGDVIVDDDDACPDEPEDIDGLEEDDGCPDADHDRDPAIVDSASDSDDSVVDVVDKCPDEPDEESEDMDGCPDPAPHIVVDVGTQ